MDEVAEGIWQTEHSAAGVQSIVSLTAGVEELRQRVSRDAEKGGGGSRSRQAAFVRLLEATAFRHGFSGREAVSSRLHAKAAETVAMHFGYAGLGGQLTELRLRAGEATKGHQAALLAPSPTARDGQRRWWARRELALYHEAWQREERGMALICLARAAADGSSCLPQSETMEWLLECERHYPWGEGGAEVELELFYAYLNLGMPDKAQRQLELLEPWRRRDCGYYCSWALIAAEWRIATGHFQEAQSELERAIAMAREHAFGAIVLHSERLLVRCEQDLHASRRRRRPTQPSGPAGA